MRIFVKAKPSAKRELVQKVDGINFKVFVKESPREGRANKAIARVLAEYLGVPVRNVELVSGFSSRSKVFDVKG
jgi:uncharacterized protein